MDALTKKQKMQIYDEIGELIFKYDKDKTAKRMLKALFKEVEDATTTSDIANMRIVLASLKHLLKLTFPNK